MPLEKTLQILDSDIDEENESISVENNWHEIFLHVNSGFDEDNGIKFISCSSNINGNVKTERVSE